MQVAATVLTHSGDVQVERDGQKIPLDNGDSIYESDRIHTGDNSIAILKFKDNSEIELGENTNIKLSDFSYGDNEPVSFVLNLAEGLMRSVSGEVVKQNPDAFKLVTPMSTVGIRGTTTGHTVGETKETHIVIALGAGHTVIITATSSGHSTIISEALQGVTLQDGLPNGIEILQVTPEMIEIYEKLQQQLHEIAPDVDAENSEFFVLNLIETTEEIVQQIVEAIQDALPNTSLEVVSTEPLVETTELITQAGDAADAAAENFSSDQVIPPVIPPVIPTTQEHNLGDISGNQTLVGTSSIDTFKIGTLSGPATLRTTGLADEDTIDITTVAGGAASDVTIEVNGGYTVNIGELSEGIITNDGTSGFTPNITIDTVTGNTVSNTNPVDFANFTDKVIIKVGTLSSGFLSAIIVTGEGDDEITIDTITTGGQIVSNQGNDMITVEELNSRGTISAGSGDDTIIIGTLATTGDILAGAGNDTIKIGGVLGDPIVGTTTRIDFEGGSDSVFFGENTGDFDISANYRIDLLNITPGSTLNFAGMGSGFTATSNTSGGFTIFEIADGGGNSLNLFLADSFASQADNIVNAITSGGTYIFV